MVENISIGGLFVRTDKLEEVGSQIFVDLVRPGWKRQLTLMARVTSRVDSLAGHISHKPPGMGVQFQRLEPEHFERLRKLLEDLGAPEHGDLPDADASELELRPLEPDDVDPLDPEPQPLWKQLEMIAAELDMAPLDPVEFEQPIPPAPLAPITRPPEPPPQAARGRKEPSPRSAAQGGAAGSPATSPSTLSSTVSAAVPVKVVPDDTQARLMLQIRGLVLQLSETQEELAHRDTEVQRLRDQLEHANDELDSLRAALLAAAKS